MTLTPNPKTFSAILKIL